jgi:hypothetical protein
MAFDSPIQLPVGVTIVAGLWFGGMYLASPSLGMRKLQNDGAVEQCENERKTEVAAALARAENSLSAEPQDTSGHQAKVVLDVLSGLFMSDQKRRDFMDVHGDTVRGWMRPVEALVEKKTEGARRALDAKRAEIAEQFRVDPDAAASECLCRASLVVNENVSAIATSFSTFGLLSSAPLNDWGAAMRAPGVIARCRKGGA